MATAGGFHHHGKAGNGGMGHRERGRSYGLMLLLAFAAALLGVMALHKLRERRILNIILKDKDRELFSLSVLLQKEKENTNEMQKKMEEMKADIYSLRTKKMEADSRVLEMESTISSLKDEQRALELALDEKREEIKALHREEVGDIKGDIPEVLNQRELEIAHLKQQLESTKMSLRGSESSIENNTVARVMDMSKTQLGVSNGTVLSREAKLRDGGNVTGQGSVHEEPAGENNHEKLGKLGSAGSKEEQNPDNHGIRDDSNVITTDDGSRMEVSTVIEGKAELEKLDDESNQLVNESKHWASTIRKVGDGNGSGIKVERRRALVRKRRLDRKRDPIMMRHRKFIGDAAQFVAENKLEYDAEKEQDRGLIMNGMDQVGDREKIFGSSNGDGMVGRKEDTDQDRPGNGETSEGNMKEGGVGVEDEDTSGEEQESEGNGNESAKQDQSRLGEQGGPEEVFERGEERRHAGRLIHNVSKGATNVGNIGGNQEGDASAEEVLNKTEAATIGDEEDSPDSEETDRNFTEKYEEDSTDPETSRDLTEKDASKVEDQDDEYKEETDESEF